VDFQRAQPPEIVPKTTTANIFNTKDADDNDDDDSSPSIEKSSSPKMVTYDELRQRNRAEYASKYPAVKPSPSPPPQPVVANEQTTTNKKRSTVRKNQYGDEIYD